MYLGGEGGAIDIPLPVRRRWQQITIAMKQIGRLEDLICAVKSRPSPVNGMLKSSDAKMVQASYDKEVERLSAMIERTKIDAQLVVPRDERFASYWESMDGGYEWRREQALADDAILIVPGEGEFTSYTFLVEELRDELLHAILRIRGNELQQSRHDLWDQGGG